ncbi:MAG TPA: O-antigen ligase family protein [Patescibacteria group bacterium]|nr:O-antigen ligase family protein [Patescibacteria group bacterium]
MKQLQSIKKYGSNFVSKWLIFTLGCYFFFFPFGQLLRIQTPFSSVPFFVPDLFVLLFSLSGLLLFRKKHLKVPGLLPGMGFFLVAFVSLGFSLQVFSMNQVTIGSLYLLRFIAYFLMYPTVIILLQNGLLRTRTLSLFLFFSAVGFLFSVGIQMFFAADFRSMVQYGWDPHIGRVLGSFFDPNYAGGFLVFLQLFFLSFFWEEKKKAVRILMLILLLVSYICFFYAFSRSSYLMYLMSFLVVGLVRSWKVLLVAVTVFLLSLQIVPRSSERIVGAVERDVTSVARTNSWERGLLFVSERPILGWGFNMTRYTHQKYGYEEIAASHGGSGIDSSLLFVLVTTGVFGLALYTFVWVEVVEGVFREVKNSPFAVAALAGVIGLFLHSLFVNSLFYPEIIGWMFPFLGIVVYKERK